MRSNCGATGHTKNHAKSSLLLSLLLFTYLVDAAKAASVLRTRTVTAEGHARRHPKAKTQSLTSSTPFRRPKPAFPADTHNRAAVCTPYHLTPGGGEKYIFSIMRELQRYAYVDLIVMPYNVCQDTNCVMKLAATLDVAIDESRLRVLVAPLYEQHLIGMSAEAYRVFVLLGNDARPQIMPYGRYNVYMCQFPFDLGTPFSERDLLVFNAYDRVLVNSRYSFRFYQNGTEAAVRELETRGMLSPELRIVHPQVSNMSGALSLVREKNPGLEIASKGLGAPKNRVSIAVVGRFFRGRQSKGHGSAIEALRVLIKKDKTRSYELHLIGAIAGGQGQDDLLASLREKAKDLPVNFHIEASREELVTVLAESTFIWHLTGVDNTEHDPASNEHFGISVVEGMQLGCMPVVYYLGGPREIVMNDERFLAKDVEEYAKRSLHLLSLPEDEFRAILKRMSARAADFFEDAFSKKLAANEFFDFQTWYEYKHHVQYTMPELYSKQCAFAPNSNKMAIIIEPRRNPLFEYVVRNAAFYLDNKWMLRVYHGTENADFVREKLQSCHNVKYVNLGVENVSIEGLNRILMSIGFWKKIDTENVLIFQTDSLLLRKGIDAFLDYDFVGAPWHQENEVYKYTDLKLRVGNGGLSLRRTASMLEALQKCDRKSWRKSRQKENEDFFYARCLDILGKNMPDYHTAASFAVEVPENSSYLSTAIGLHKPFAYLNRAQMLTALDSSEI